MDEEVQKKPNKPIAAKAYALLAQRAYFSKQLREKLLEKGYGEGEIDGLLAQLTERGWLNDQELAERYVLEQKRKGYGALVIRMKLKEKAGEIFRPIEDSEEELAAFVEKKYLRDLPDRKDKVVAALARRGFPYHLINNVLQTMMSSYENF